MKKLSLLVLAFCLVCSYAFAQEAATLGSEASVPAVTDETVTITGTIIDNICVGLQKPEELGEFVKTHPKSCAVMPQCAASGYAIYADGIITKFDKDSSVKITEFLDKEDSSLNVVITAKKAGEELSLVSIESQKEAKE
ncbi:MAG: hypothetical protein Q8L26_03405 [Candidatus Omnitrophota bacterium]|nr:hypothetical protein [Candidatus Omnitrophota bacterium]